jgi:plasmid stabilization system protein ParE
MASISEFERARMITALAGAIGKEEANVLASALNLEGQLASRDELRVTEMAIRTDIADLRDNLRSELASVRDDLRVEIGSVRDDLRTEIGSVRDDLRAEIGSVRDDLRAEIGSVRHDLRAEIGSVRDDVHALRLELYTVKDDLKDGFARSLQEQTRSLFFGILGGIGTITGAVMVALRVAGKL